MNYDKIDELLHQKGVSKMKFYEAIGVTHTGFARMMQNKTFTVETLEKVANYFNLSVSYFFEENAKKVATIPDLKDKISELYEENKKLSDENRVLMKENGSLKEKIYTLEKNSAVPENVPIPKLKEKK